MVHSGMQKRSTDVSALIRTTQESPAAYKHCGGFIACKLGLMPIFGCKKNKKGGF